MTRVTNPRLAALGLMPGPSAPPQPSRLRPLPTRNKPRSAFVDELPQYEVEPAYFHVLSVAGVSVGTGESAWYGLRRIRSRDIGEDFCLTGCAMDLLPTDSAGGAISGYTGTILPWGDARGILAAIVIGRNLPITPNAWTSAKAFIPGIEGGNTANNTHTLESSGKMPRYFVVQSFPTGTYRDTAPNKPPYRSSFAPHVARITENDSLDCALVVTGSQINGASGIIVGMANVRMTIGLTESRADFKEV